MDSEQIMVTVFQGAIFLGLWWLFVKMTKEAAMNKVSVGMGLGWVGSILAVFISGFVFVQGIFWPRLFDENALAHAMVLWVIFLLFVLGLGGIAFVVSFGSSKVEKGIIMQVRARKSNRPDKVVASVVGLTLARAYRRLMVGGVAFILLIFVFSFVGISDLDLFEKTMKWLGIVDLGSASAVGILFLSLLFSSLLTVLVPVDEIKGRKG